MKSGDLGLVDVSHLTLTVHNLIRTVSQITDYDELLHHLHFTNAKCSTFFGRDELFCAIEKYLKSTKRKPLVLYAESGAGKTSVMAKLMQLIPTW